MRFLGDGVEGCELGFMRDPDMLSSAWRFKILPLGIGVERFVFRLHRDFHE